MNNYKYWKIKRDQLERLKKETISTLLKHNKDYSNTIKRLDKKEMDYLSLPLMEDQRERIEEYLHAIDCMYLELNMVNYIAGILDSQKIKESFHLPLITEPLQKKHILETLYEEGNISNKKDQESLKMKLQWEEMRKAEDHFYNKLKEGKKMKFAEILERRADYLAMYQNQEFVSGFQIGAKMMIEVFTDFNG